MGHFPVRLPRRDSACPFWFLLGSQQIKLAKISRDANHDGNPMQ